MEIAFLLRFFILLSTLWYHVATFDLLGFIHPNNNPVSTAAEAGTVNTFAFSKCNITTMPLKPICDCNEAGMEADCSHKGTEDLPSEITFPPIIKIASFRDNLISVIKYETFYGAPNVTDLDLSNNRINFISAQAFQAFKQLRRLDLSHNRLWIIHKQVLEWLLDLRELDLSYNDISSITRESFQPVSKLQVLNLESNPLYSLDAKQFEYLPSLVSLDLDATMLQDLPDNCFLITKNLKRVSLANNQMVKIPTTAFKLLDKVQNLDLSGNIFQTVPPNAFRGMKSLIVLYLDRLPELIKIDECAFSGLTHLDELHCSYNYNLREFHEHAFLNNATGKLLNIEQLFIRQNKLSSLSFQLLPWNEYMEIHLRDNPWNCDCHMIWMLGTQLKNSFQDQITCHLPANLNGRHLSSLKAEDMICGISALDILLIVIGVTVAFLIILLMVAFCVWKRHYSNVSKTYFRVSKSSDCEDVVYEKTTYDPTDH